jgi:type IV pilus assembly protein PilA
MPVAVGGGLMAAMAIPAFQKVRQTSQEQTARNNLRQIASAADQYFLEEGVAEVTYEQLVGPDAYIRSIEPVAGEVYEGMVITTEMDEISVTLPDGRVISIPF